MPSFDLYGPFKWCAVAVVVLICLEHSHEALELSKMQEMTRQQEFQLKAKEYEAHIEQAKVEQKRIDHEERRKTLVVILLQQTAIFQQFTRKDGKVLSIICLWYPFFLFFFCLLRKRPNNSNNEPNIRINCPGNVMKINSSNSRRFSRRI